VRGALLRSLAVLLVGGILLAGILYVASTVDSRPPVVTRIALTQHLESDDAIALTTTSVTVAYSEVVDHASAEAAFSVAPPIDGSFSWSGTTLTFTPTDPLPLEADFVVTVGAGTRDTAGNRMDAGTGPLAFATVGPPQVASTVPADGDTAIARDAGIEVAFSTLMDTASVEAALTITPRTAVTLRWRGERLTVTPDEPLQPGRRYRLQISTDATDLGGTQLDMPLELSFVTARTDLEISQLVPADEVEGIAVTTPIAIVFDRPLDPASVDGGLLSIEPDVAGSLEVVDLPGAAGLGDDGPRLLRFVPSGTLAATTTYEVSLAPGLRAADGGELSEAVTWTFTTGAPSATLSNQVVFLSQRSGLGNVWAMNPDGSNQHQVTTSLSPITDFAVAPDGRSLVSGDGVQLVEQAVDGRDRRLLTDAAHLEFDPSYSPDGRTIIFARADLATGGGLGIWRRGVAGGEATQFAAPDAGESQASSSPSSSASPSAAASPDPLPLLRAPVYAPDGSAVAYVDTAGRVAIVDLETQRQATALLAAAAPPVWLPDSTAVLVSGVELDRIPAEALPHPASTAVLPLDPASDLAAGSQQVLRLLRNAEEPQATPLDGPARLAIAANGRIASVVVPRGAAGGALWITTGNGGAQSRLLDATPDVITFAAFTPEAGTLIAARATRQGVESGIVLVDLDTGRVEDLAPDGTRPRWLP
jgi:hypothetical protein